MNKPVVVIPNWNGEAELTACIDSLLVQSVQAHVIVVDNGSIDNSISLIESKYPHIELIKHTENKGYAGGVNPGFRRAIELGAAYVAPFNNDAIADKQWLERLVGCLEKNQDVGIATCKVASIDGSHLDSTGDYYTTWGLPYPRGRGEQDERQYDNDTGIFGASGAASLYRVSMLEQIGLLDEDFFAYYEDVDLSFRAQLAGWKVRYVPQAVVYHATSTTSAKIKGFFTYQTQKNLPMLLLKNVPASLLPTILPRFLLVYLTFFVSAFQRGQLLYALQGAGKSLLLLPKKLGERRHIQTHKKVSDSYIRNMLHWDLPPNAARLRRLRSAWWKLTRKKTA
ncbi:MAG TPA: glycosyltransferase family 2 protein [Candidatus Limnocylindrales bacterium]|nr:glycosyltransferase family 2 protein [Candidatus Limnocylindrales bacterium]